VLIEYRLIDTLLGTVVALLAGLFLWRGSSSARLPVLLSETIQSSGEILKELLKQAGSQHGQYYQQKNRLSTLLINLRSVYDGSSREMRTKFDQVEAYWLSIVAAERLGYFVIAAMESPVKVSIESDKLAQISSIFKQLTERTQQQQPIDDLTFPDIPEYPGITREVNELIASLSIKDLRIEV
jgi:hypothetical protein